MNVKEKYGRLDLQAVINENTIVVIEMQKEDRGYMEKRAVYYAGKVIGSSLEKGETYDKMKEIIVICILDYEMNPMEEYFTKAAIIEEKYKKYVVINGLKFYFIELPKFRKEVNKIETKLESWLAFIDYERKDMVKMAVKVNEKVKKTKLTYEYLTGDEAQKRLQELRERAEMDELAAKHYGIEIGQKQGEKRGIKRRNFEIAKNMLNKNISIELIMECTGLTKEEVEKLAV